MHTVSLPDNTEDVATVMVRVSTVSRISRVRVIVSLVLSLVCLSAEL